jgi:hypothetical protein
MRTNAHLDVTVMAAQLRAKYAPSKTVPNRRFTSSVAATHIGDALYKAAQDASLTPYRVNKHHYEKTRLTVAHLYEQMIESAELRSAIARMLNDARDIALLSRR